MPEAMSSLVAPTTPYTVAYVESVTKGVATYRVAWVRDGKRRDGPTGPSFTEPRQAVRYAERLERRAAQEAVA
jgi:hypothetical protein